MLAVMRNVAAWAVTAVPVLWAAFTSGPGRFAAWEAITALLVLAIAVALVRRRPVAALAVVVAGWLISFCSRIVVDSSVAVGAFAGLAVISFLAGRHAADGYRGAVVLVAGTATSAVATWVVSGSGGNALAGMVGIAVLGVVPWSVGRYRHRYADLIQVGWERAELWEREAEAAADHARARERERLAGEMHDLVGHALAQATLRIGALELEPALDSRHREVARGAREGLTEAAERLADAVRVLRSDHDAPVESVADLVARARESGLTVELVTSGRPSPDPIIARTLHRVVAESLTNAMKHAPGAVVAIRCDHGEHGTDLRVGNPVTKTPSDSATGGVGLLGLAERVHLVGGRFGAHQENGRYEVAAHLPRVTSTPLPPQTSTTRLHREHTRQQMQRTARRTFLLAAGVSAAAVAGVVGYMIFDAATSLLRPADFARLAIGDEETTVARVLPWRVRVDQPSGVPPEPAGATCRYYSTHANPFDERRSELYRLCVRDGHLVAKDLIPAGAR